MIDLSGEKSFFRFWLPLILLAGLVVLLFPKFGPRNERTAREAWDGMVVLVSFEEPPPDSYILATMPLRTTRAYDEWWVIGSTEYFRQPESMPILLGTPAGSELSRRLSRRVVRDRSRLHSAEPVFKMYRRADFGKIPPPLLGAIIRTPRAAALSGSSETGTDTIPGTSELISGTIQRSIPPPLYEWTRTVTLEPSRDRRWIGNPATFHADWNRFRDLDPGGLTPFIHERWTLPAAALGVRGTDPPPPATMDER